MISFRKWKFFILIIIIVHNSHITRINIEHTQNSLTHIKIAFFLNTFNDVLNI